jgi:hypothetical protein
MQLKKQEREFFRKLLENFIVKNPHLRQFQVVDHYEKGPLDKRFIII